MRHFIFILCLFSQLIFAQNKRFIYQYTFIPDSTNKAHAIKEFMFLDVVNGTSSFFSQRKYVLDSTLIAPQNKGKMIIPPRDLTLLYTIEKKDGKVFYKELESSATMRMKVYDDRKMDWKVLGDKQQFLHYNAQKASLDFGGRKWTTWFTQDIPIQDGPYKFNGLPGLIVKMEDTTKSHVFELVGISNLSDKYSYPEQYGYMNEVEFSLAEFKKKYLQYRKDPGADIRRLYIEGRIPDQLDASGKFRTGAEMVKEVEQLEKEKVKKDNNIIEIDLIKNQ
ncbi:GLPGLI family protein [Chryseobacterium sp. PMSZPI]|uniref:GLPGLI family protein n=1 Tax=Chryseobacterium sp. PMSZPI TaxID=1033900 RepID=UPI000C31DDB1|nr:GLPGLI family protein [Chryseobacterium sp. PMSZPI]PKF74919.1 GLPGLI family protein [Chryseobacterium sp. PMSZPI]